MLEDAAPEEILAWAARAYGSRVALACSFGGPSGHVLVDMVARLRAPIDVYYLDTGLLFKETYAHIERVSNHYGITPIAVRPSRSIDEQAAAFGARLWERDPERCCNLRKVEPQREFLRNYDAWISGIRRDQSQTREQVRVVSWDASFGLAKINPLAHWTDEMVWTYIQAHDVPYNPLHDRGYRSIGCSTCTLAVRANEPLRAGRWKPFAKTECGLHQ